jgi:alanyl-tRNA synthetase
MTMTSSEIRQSFLEFFRGKNHQIVPSSPVVLPADPTLLFANAGMNQFKEIFLGVRESSYKRVADTQKCIRVSGKQNDLEEVGFDTYHHTFFEMLGNWSFGDYYKKEAIEWAWELFTEVYELPKDRLWVTVYKDDDEAEGLWRDVTDINPDHVLRFDEKDNFWEMGETGPCGPCSEIHIDLTENGADASLVNADSPEVIELWNLVFIQFNRRSDGQLEELPDKHVDTGMGFERLVAVLQGKKSNYDTDVFQPLISHLEKMSGRSYEGDNAVAMRVVADHIRMLSFAVADGVLPSNDGRGYVLRRILRRAVRFGRNLGFNRAFMGELFPVVEETLAGTFPELSEHRDNILRALKSEEESFASTLERGMTLFDEAVNNVKEGGANAFSGDDAFKLYDTYGFPMDLTRLMASERGLTLDEDRFEVLMNEQRDRARGTRKNELLAAETDLIAELVSRGVKSEFNGYREISTGTGVLEILGQGISVDVLTEGQEGVLLLAQTPFYAESGGQVGDEGRITGPAGQFDVWDTQRPGEGLILHVGKVVSGTVSKGESVTAEVDGVRRNRLARHHSATHLLNAALREVVDGQIKQAGSLVAPDRLRFDFNCFEAVNQDQLAQMERRVNEWVIRNDEVSTYEMALKDVPGSGIVAVFDEKYGDVVRVVDIGGYSKELCGGTHVDSIGEIGCFRITGESSVAAGIRRIEAVCGEAAFEMNRREHQVVQQLSQQFSVAPDELPDRIASLLEQNKSLERVLKKQEQSAAEDRATDLADHVRDVDGVALITGAVGELPMDALRKVMDGIRGRVSTGVILLGSRSGGKACFVASVSDDWVEKGLNAGKIVSAVAKVAGGGGGGQPGKAQAGGRDGSKVEEAVESAEGVVRQMVAND